MTDSLKVGDIVLNGYQSKPYNMYLIIGSTSRKTGPFSRTRYYRTQHIIDGETLEGVALFSKTDNKLEKIAHVNTKEVISTAIKEALLTSNKEKDKEK